MASASTVAVVVPSPAILLVFEAASLTSWPRFSWGSSRLISSATVTPSLVTLGAPQPLSRTAFRPRGPRVVTTARANLLTPAASGCRASSSYTICFATVESSCCGLEHLSVIERISVRWRLPRPNLAADCVWATLRTQAVCQRGRKHRKLLFSIIVTQHGGVWGLSCSWGVPHAAGAKLTGLSKMKTFFAMDRNQGRPFAGNELFHRSPPPPKTLPNITLMLYFSCMAASSNEAYP